LFHVRNKLIKINSLKGKKMTKLKLLFSLVVLAVVFGFNSESRAQNGPVLYFCESYTSSGEVGISDRFTTGYLTVMVKCDYALGLSDVSIQFDKYNPTTRSFEYNKKFPYDVEPNMKYIYFASDDLTFDSPGIYRVFLLDSKGQTVTSGLVEIISR
jgi:hypothetical protein